MIAQYVPIVMSAVLIAAMALELKVGRIPNWLTLIPLVLFVGVLAMAEDRTPFYWQFGIAAGVFVVGLLLYAFAGFGAGAVKLMSGLALFVPFAKGANTLLVFVGALFVVSFLIVQLRKFFADEQSKWFVWAKPVLPMSLPIGIAGIASFFLL